MKITARIINNKWLEINGKNTKDTILIESISSISKSGIELTLSMKNGTFFKMNKYQANIQQVHEMILRNLVEIDHAKELIDKKAAEAKKIEEFLDDDIRWAEIYSINNGHRICNILRNGGYKKNKDIVFMQRSEFMLHHNAGVTSWTALETYIKKLREDHNIK